MTPLADTTAAVLVVYRLQQPIDDVLRELKTAVARIVVVDNSAHGHPGLRAVAERFGARCLHGGNVGGLAGAYNRALAELQRLRRAGAAIAQIVFLDEDSDPHTLGGFLADPQVAERLADVRTAAVAPAYRDRATGMRGKYIVLRRFALEYLPRQFDGLRAVAFVINSMSVWRLEAIERIGAFDERLAIDHVDTEYCLRARQLGLAMYVHGSHEFAHAIGQRRRFRFLGRDMQAGGHPPPRRRLIGRNTVHLARIWLRREPAFAMLCLSRLAYEVVGIVAAEDDKRAKLAALISGAWGGLFMRRAA